MQHASSVHKCKHTPHLQLDLVAKLEARGHAQNGQQHRHQLKALTPAARKQGRAKEQAMLRPRSGWYIPMASYGVQVKHWPQSKHPPWHPQ